MGFENQDTTVEFKDLDGFIEETQPINSLNRAITKNLYGFNHRKVKSGIPSNRDNYGYVFFTRPQLNLTNENLRNYRDFYSLLNTKRNSMSSFVKATLDPRLRCCDLVNESTGFIPILTNLVKTVSGWPDIVAPTFTSKEGVRKEQWTMIDGTTDLYQQYDLDVTFNNDVQDEVLTTLFNIWDKYPTLTFEGVCNPYLDFILENELDYNTRIYRLVMSSDNKYVKKISATGASFPVNLPMGQYFDFSNERPFNDQTKDLTIRFPSTGAIYNDPILIYTFNKTSAIFNKDMENPSKSELEKVPRELIDRYNFMGIPYINPYTLELEWYVDYKLEKIKEFKSREEKAELTLLKGVL